MAQVRAFNPPQPSDSQVAALKLPPHSIEAEQSLIGGLLIDNAAWDRIGDVVRETDFYRDDHRRIFRHIGKLIQMGRPADVVTVYESIEQSNEVDQTGGLGYLGEIANATPSAANIRRYAEIVRERAILRQLVTVGDEIAGNALNPAGRDVKQLLDDAEQAHFPDRRSGQPQQQRLRRHPAPARRSRRTHGNPAGARQPVGHHRRGHRVRRSRPHDFGSAGRRHDRRRRAPVDGQDRVRAEHRRACRRRTATAGGDLQPGNVGAATRHALSVIRRPHRPEQAAHRPPDRRRVGPHDGRLGKLHEAPIHIDETGAINSTDLRARARRLHRQFGKLGLIIIDYLQLMSSNRMGENRATEISEISRSIKALAKELQVPIIALSQLSRKVEERTDKRPLMSDLRESGAIEQDADIIMMMYREEYYKPDTQDKGTAEAIIGKHRNGPVGHRAARIPSSGDRT
jgi:replicative DNA helicase